MSEHQADDFNMELWCIPAFMFYLNSVFVKIDSKA